jgi:hypothetical protein
MAEYDLIINAWPALKSLPAKVDSDKDEFRMIGKLRTN